MRIAYISYQMINNNNIGGAMTRIEAIKEDRMKKQILQRNQLTVGQEKILSRWEAESRPTEVVKLGYSIGSRGNNNFHSTWAFRSTSEIVRIYGDGRSTWRQMIRKYGRENVRA